MGRRRVLTALQEKYQRKLLDQIWKAVDRRPIPATASGVSLLALQPKPGRGGARSGPHTALVKACLSWLAVHKIAAWSMNVGAFKTERGGFFRAAFPGCSDILGILAPRGRFLAVECKTGRGRLTDDQRAFQRVVEGAGGVFVEARSVDDLVVLKK
jgi:hypothetical protein